jgi:hypothetical protein
LSRSKSLRICSDIGEPVFILVDVGSAGAKESGMSGPRSSVISRCWFSDGLECDLDRSNRDPLSRCCGVGLESLASPLDELLLEKAVR